MTTAALFGIFRRERDGIADDDAKRRMRLIAPHIRRAVLIGKAIDLKTAETATFADALDGLSAAMFLTQANGRIVHANAAGHAMLAGSGFLYAARDRLMVRDVKMHQALMEVLAAAASGDSAVGARGVALPLATRDGGAYLAHVLPLTSGARRQAGSAYAAAAAIFVRKAALELPSMPETIARHYRLTPVGAAGSLGRHRSRRRAGGCRRARHRRHHRQDPSRQRLRQDRDVPAGRPRQAGRGLRKPARRMTALSEELQLSRLVGELYDAALDPALWTVALQGVRDFVGGASAGIVAKDASANRGFVCFDDGSIAPGLHGVLLRPLCGARPLHHRTRLLDGRNPRLDHRPHAL